MSTQNYRVDHKAVMDSILLEIPGVTASTAFGYPAYKVNNKVFCFVGGLGVAIKLGAERVKALISTDETRGPFEVAEGVIWKEWLSIDRQQSADYHQDRDLFDESVGYVGGGGKDA